MSDPKRLLELVHGEASTLLKAAREVPPPPSGALEQTLASLGVAAPVAAAAGVSTLGVAKLVLIGAAIGVGVSAGVVAMQDTKPVTPPATSSAPQAVPAPSRLELPSALPTPAVAMIAPSQRPTSPPAKPRVASRLSEEIAEIDRARSLLDGGQASRALAVLDEYDARFRAGQLAPEAALLRVRALAMAGQLAAAQSLARQLLDRSSDVDYSARVREAAKLSEP